MATTYIMPWRNNAMVHFGAYVPMCNSSHAGRPVKVSMPCIVIDAYASSQDVLCLNLSRRKRGRPRPWDNVLNEVDLVCVMQLSQIL